MIHQMLCKPWFKWEKSSFIWNLIEMTLMSVGDFPEVGFAGRKSEEESQQKKSICEGGAL